MERWAANTLRTLGIVLISGFVMLSCAFLLLLSMCAYQGNFGGERHPEQGPWYIAAAAAVLIVGIWAVAVLARGIMRASAAAAVAPALALDSATQTAGTHPAASVPLHLSPVGRKAIENLVIAIAAQLAITAAVWLLNLHRLSPNLTRIPAYHWTLILTFSFVLCQIPYVILIIALVKRPDRRAFTYSIAVPAILILQTLFSSSLVSYYLIRHPEGIILLAIPFIMDIVVLVLAYKAIQHVGLHPQPSSLIVAAVVTFIYFSIMRDPIPFLYRFVR